MFDAVGDAVRPGEQAGAEDERGQALLLGEGIERHGVVSDRVCELIGERPGDGERAAEIGVGVAEQRTLCLVATGATCSAAVEHGAEEVRSLLIHREQPDVVQHACREGGVLVNALGASEHLGEHPGADRVMPERLVVEVVRLGERPDHAEASVVERTVRKPSSTTASRTLPIVLGNP